MKEQRKASCMRWFCLVALLVGCGDSDGPVDSSGRITSTAFCEEVAQQCPDDYTQDDISYCEETCDLSPSELSSLDEGGETSSPKEICYFAFCENETGFCDNEEEDDVTVMDCIVQHWGMGWNK